MDWFLSLNAPTLERTFDAPVISFSHFLPLPECLPDKSKLFIKFLPKVVGTTALDVQVRVRQHANDNWKLVQACLTSLSFSLQKLNSVIHAFGHTHIVWNRKINNIWYTQRCLKYPRERNKYPQYSIDSLGDMILWDDENDIPNRCEEWKLPYERASASASSSSASTV